MVDHNGKILADGIVALSEADDWFKAKLEWELHHIYFDEDTDTCLCSHHPIIEICILKNKLNGNEATVGNVCVNKFLDLPSHLIFAAYKRVKVDIGKSLNWEALQYAENKNLINNWELNFMLNIMKKRNLSEKQHAKRKEINTRLIRDMNRKAEKGKLDKI